MNFIFYENNQINQQEGGTNYSKTTYDNFNDFGASVSNFTFTFIILHFMHLESIQYNFKAWLHNCINSFSYLDREQ